MKTHIKTLTIICLTSALFLFFGQKTEATILTPSISEYILSASERDASTITIQNTENKTITVTPKIYPYDPESETLLLENGYTFLKADIEEFKIAANGEFEINYEIIPPNNLTTGTYFNLLVLEEIANKQVIQDTNPVNTTNNLAHLVVLHIVEGGTVQGIDTNFATVDIQVVDRGIPFIKPLIIRYTYQNITNYVLEPEGEIQVYNTDGKYEPVYVKINKTDEKLYPGDTREEEIEINKWHILDIFYNKEIIGRFYNGIDENHISTSTSAESFTTYAIAGILSILLLGIFLKSLRQDTKR